MRSVHYQKKGPWRYRSPTGTDRLVTTSTKPLTDNHGVHTRPSQGRALLGQGQGQCGQPHTSKHGTSGIALHLKRASTLRRSRVDPFSAGDRRVEPRGVCVSYSKLAGCTGRTQPLGIYIHCTVRSTSVVPDMSSFLPIFVSYLGILSGELVSIRKPYSQSPRLACPCRACAN